MYQSIEKMRIGLDFFVAFFIKKKKVSSGCE